MSAPRKGTLYILIGKLASGKSTYARSLPACFTLSADRWMRALFPEGCGPLHEQYSERVFSLLFEDARALTDLGLDVILDTGMWTRANRAQAMEAFAETDTRWIWINPPEEVRRRRIAQRNAAVLAGEALADYLVDDGLFDKCERLFEPPTVEEIPDLLIVRNADSADPA